MTSEATLEERLNYIETVIRNDDFRSVKGLGNNIPYYVFDYPPNHELLVREHVDNLVKKINSSNLAFTICCFDLYELVCQIIEEKRYLEKCNSLEEQKGSDFLMTAVTKMLKLTNTDNPVISYIVNNTPENSIVFLTGIGKSYPIIRAHNILNNLEQVLDSVPVVMFYPGKHEGNDFHLFGTIYDENYYRALPFPRPTGDLK